MESVSDRVWIPYHVGLEFQRNRLDVIAKQYHRYSEVKTIVSTSLSGMENKLNELQLNKRHSHIDPNKLVKDIGKINIKFFEELDKQAEESINVNSIDTIRKRIDSLFDKKLGDAPEKQADIDRLFEEGKQRYAYKIPPGFEDSNKSKLFTYSGLVYKQEYGDFILWKQMIEHVKISNIKDLIFVTDDNKSDWWLKIESSGSEVLVARPELTDEISRETNVERFYMYNSESFLKYAKEQLNAEVTDDAINEIREVSSARYLSRIQKIAELQDFQLSAQKSVYEWLSTSFKNIEYNKNFPDFIGYKKIKQQFFCKLQFTI